LGIQQQSPQLIIHHAFAPNPQIEADLIARNIDIGLMTKNSTSAELISEQIAVEPLLLVTANNISSVNWHKLQALGFISHPDAAHHARLLLSENFAEFTHIEQFPHKGFSNQIGLILEPVSRGLGFTVLPLHAVNAFHHPSAICKHKLANPVTEKIYLCHNRNAFTANRSKHIQAVIKHYLTATQ